MLANPVQTIMNPSSVAIAGASNNFFKMGRDLEERVFDIAKRYKIRFLGPNCIGIINTQLPLNLTVMPVHDYNGKLGIASQSGTYVTQNLSYLHKHGR